MKNTVRVIFELEDGLTEYVGCTNGDKDGCFLESNYQSLILDERQVRELSIILEQQNNPEDYADNSEGRV